MTLKTYLGALAALWTACAFATPQEIIAINFGAEHSSLDTSSSEAIGFQSEDGTKGGTLALSSWNNIREAKGTWTVTGSSGNHYTLEWSAPNTYWSVWVSNDTSLNKRLTYGYLDVATSTTVSFSIKGLPAKYDVALIASGDGGESNPGVFSPFEINSKKYTYNSGTVEGDSTWGKRVASDNLTEGDNVLYISDQTSPTLTISNVQGNGRGSIAGVMVFVTDNTRTTYSATLGENQDASAISWDGSTPSFNGSEAISLTTADAGSTVTLNQAFSADCLTVGGNGTLTFGAGAGALTVDSLVLNTNLTLNTDAAIKAALIGENKAVTIGEGKTLSATKGFLASCLSNDAVTTSAIPVSGGTLALDLGAGKTLKMSGSGENATLGNLTVTSGTLEFNTSVDSWGKGPGYGRTITLKGENTTLKLSAQDGTGWTVSNNKIVLADGAKMLVGKRDTFASTLELAGGTLELQAGAENGGRGFDWHCQTGELVVTKDSAITYASGITDDSKYFAIRGDAGGFYVNVSAGATLRLAVPLKKIDNPASLSKRGDGMLLITEAHDSSMSIPVNVETGILALEGEGSLGSGAVTVKAGATLDLGTQRTVNLSTLESSAIVKIAQQDTEMSVVTLTGTALTAVDAANFQVFYGESEVAITEATVADGTVTLTLSQENIPTWSASAGGNISEAGWTPEASKPAIIDVGTGSDAVTITLDAALSTTPSSILITGTAPVTFTGSVPFSCKVIIEQGAQVTAAGMTALTSADIENNGTLTLNGSGNSLFGSTYSGNGATILASGTQRISNDAVRASAYTGTWTLNGGYLRWGEGNALSAGSTTSLGSAITINSGAQLTLWPWTTQVLTESLTDKVTISTPITLNGGTIYTEDGSYVLDALNITAASTLTMQWRKGLVVRRFWGSGNLSVVNNPSTDSNSDPAQGARFTFLYPNEAGSADAAAAYTGTLTASISFGSGYEDNQYMILKPGAANTFSAATVKVASKHISLPLGENGTTLNSGTVIFTNAAVKGASFGEETTWTLNGGTLQWGDGDTNPLAAGDSTSLGGSVEVNDGATLKIWPWTDSSKTKNPVSVSTAITLNGGTLWSEDGAYDFSKIDVQANSIAQFKWDKTIKVSTLLGAGDLRVYNEDTTWGGTDLTVVNTREENGGNYTGKMTVASPKNTVTLGSAQAFDSATLAIEKDASTTPTLKLAQDTTVANLSGYATVASADGTTARLTLTGTLEGAMTFTAPVTLANGATVQVASASERPTFGSLTNAGTTHVTFADGLNQAGTVVLTSAEKQDGLTFSGAGDGLTFVSAQEGSTYQLQVATKPALPEGGSDALAQKIAQAGQDAGKTVTSVTVEEGCSLDGLELFEQVLDIADNGTATVTYDFGIDWMTITSAGDLILCAKVQQSDTVGAVLPSTTAVTVEASTDEGATWTAVAATEVTADSLGRPAADGTRYLQVAKPTQSTRYRIKASN
ncbi:MAG: beta strand repeat-containing protein [Candidatus Spyradenecus sp.]